MTFEMALEQAQETADKEGKPCGIFVLSDITHYVKTLDEVVNGEPGLARHFVTPRKDAAFQVSYDVSENH